MVVMGYMIDCFLWALTLYKTLNLTPKIQGRKCREEEAGCQHKYPNGMGEVFSRKLNEPTGCCGSQ